MVCCGMELLEALEQAEVQPSRMQASTIKIHPEGLLSWGPGLLKSVRWPAWDILEQGEVAVPRTGNVWYTSPSCC